MKSRRSSIFTTWMRLLKAQRPEDLLAPEVMEGVHEQAEGVEGFRMRNRRSRGVALLVVMLGVVILGTLSTEFAYETRGSIMASVNAESEVHAYFHARSALEIARLVIISQKVANQYLGLAKSMMPGLKSPKIELWAYACKFAEIFNSGKVEAFGMDLFDLSGRKGIGLKKGGFSCEADAEDGRVNVNQVRSLAEKQTLFYRLYPLLRTLRGSNDNDDDREIIEAALNIIDYADSDDMRSDVDPSGVLIEGTGGEGRAYMNVSYDPKNALFDSVEELRLVPSIDDDTYCLLKDRVTVYLTEKINVNTADLYVLRSLLCENLLDPAQQQACQLGVMLGPTGMPSSVDLALEWLEVCRRIKWALYTPPFNSGRQFQQFFQRLPDPLRTEIRLNNNIMKHVSTDSRVIRVKAEGTYGKVTKRLEGVIDTSTGRYVYFREN